MNNMLSQLWISTLTVCVVEMPTQNLSKATPYRLEVRKEQKK